VPPRLAMQPAVAMQLIPATACKLLYMHRLGLTRALVKRTLYIDIRSDGSQRAIRQPRREKPKVP
jgi:hypothetical protein